MLNYYLIPPGTRSHGRVTSTTTHPNAGMFRSIYKVEVLEESLDELGVTSAILLQHTPDGESMVGVDKDGRWILFYIDPCVLCRCERVAA